MLGPQDHVHCTQTSVIANTYLKTRAGFLESALVFSGIFIHAGMTNTYGGTLNYSYMKAWETSLQLVPSIEAGVLYDKFSEESGQARFILDLGIELRQ